MAEIDSIYLAQINQSAGCNPAGDPICQCAGAEHNIHPTRGNTSAFNVCLDADYLLDKIAIIFDLAQLFPLL